MSTPKNCTTETLALVKRIAAFKAFNLGWVAELTEENAHEQLSGAAQLTGWAVDALGAKTYNRAMTEAERAEWDDLMIHFHALMHMSDLLWHDEEFTPFETIQWFRLMERCVDLFA